MKRQDLLCMKMIEWNNGDPRRIQHFLKVHSFAALIGHGEAITEEKQEILEAAALVHDIGIRPAEQKYGQCGGKLQEQEGQKPAEKMLLEAGYSQKQAERAAYLVGHHHTYDKIDDIDYQILVEADFLVNLYEDGASIDVVEKTMERIFRTKTGIAICKKQFGIEKK